MFETECCQRLLAQLRVLGEKQATVDEKQTKSLKILLMLLCPNLKEEKPRITIIHVLQKVSSQGGEQTSLASKYKLAVRFSYFQTN